MAGLRFLGIEGSNHWAIGHAGKVSVKISLKEDPVEIAIRSAIVTLAKSPLGDRAKELLQSRFGIPEELWFGEARA